MFELSGLVIEQLCSNYTAWYIRKKCITELNLDLQDELDFLEEKIDGNEKVF